MNPQLPKEKTGGERVKQKCGAEEEGATVAPPFHEVSKDDWDNEPAQSVPSQAQPVGQPQILLLKFSEI